jgi:hypothetical protein
MMIVSLALIEIWEEAFNNADYLHQRYQSEGRPREIAIKAPTPGIRMHPTAIPSLIRHPNHTDKDCAKMIYSQTPNKFRVEAVKHYKGCDTLPGHEEPHKLRRSMKKSAKLPSTVISAISKVHLYQPPHGHLLFRSNSQSPPTAIWRKPDINDKEQQTMEPVEMDFSTAQIPEIDFSEYKTKKRVEMDFSMTTQEPVERV